MLQKWGFTLISPSWGADNGINKEADIVRVVVEIASLGALKLLVNDGTEGLSDLIHFVTYNC